MKFEKLSTEEMLELDGGCKITLNIITNFIIGSIVGNNGNTSLNGSSLLSLFPRW